MASGRSPGELGVETRRAERRLVTAGIALAVIVGAALLVARAAGYRGAFDHLRTAQPWWLLVALVAEIASLAGYVRVLRDVAQIDGGPALGYAKSGRIALAALGAARVVVAGGPASIVVEYWALRRAGTRKDAAAARLVALYVLLFGIFAAGAWVAALLLVLGTDGSPRLHITLPWLIAVPLVVAAAATAPRTGVREVEQLPWLRRVLADAAAGIRLVRSIVFSPRSNWRTLAAAVAYWLGDALCLWAGLRAFGVTIATEALALAYATGYLATLLPLPLGGIGGVDAAIVLALTAVGAPVGGAVLGVLAYRLVNFWLPTLPGLAAFSTLDRLGRQLQRSGAG